VTAAAQLLPLVLLAAVAGLDTVSFPQMMISRPLVAAALGGALGGEFGAGLVVGVLLELLALDTLPVGATRYPEWGSASVVAGALAAQLMDRSAAAIPLAVLVGLVTALGGGWSMIQLRKLNAQWAHQRADALARGSERTVVGLQVAGLTADLARGAAVAAVAVLVARPLVAWAASAWRLDAGIVARGDGGRNRHSGGRRALEAGGRRGRRALVPRGRARAGGRGRVAAVTPPDAALPPTRLPARVWAGIFVRLLAVQGSWSYERMAGNGIAFCIEPALRLLPGGRGGKSYRAALAREAGFFNAHPYLTAVAVGALARAELAGEPAARIDRFRTALCGPLAAWATSSCGRGGSPSAPCSRSAPSASARARRGGRRLPAGLQRRSTSRSEPGGCRLDGSTGIRVAAALNAPVLRSGPQYLARAVALVGGVAVPVALDRSPRPAAAGASSRSRGGVRGRGPARAHARPPPRMAARPGGPRRPRPLLGSPEWLNSRYKSSTRTGCTRAPRRRS
jgi:hypothetical protein